MKTGVKDVPGGGRGGKGNAGPAPFWAAALGRLARRQLQAQAVEMAARATALQALNKIREMLKASQLPPNGLLKTSQKKQQEAEAARSRGRVHARIGRMMNALMALGPTGGTEAALKRLEKRAEDADKMPDASRIKALDRMLFLIEQEGALVPANPQGMMLARQKMMEGICRLETAGWAAEKTARAAKRAKKSPQTPP